MNASTPPSHADATTATAPKLTRRSALLATAALFAPLVPQLTLARARPTPPPPGTILLNGNENPYGPSPAARQAIIAGLDRAPRYADATIEALASQVGAREGVPAAQVMVGSGSGELLRMAGLLASTTAPGSEVVASQPTYEELPVFAGQLGLQVKWVAPRYADATIEALANQVGAREGVPAAQVMVGSGSGELLRMAGLLASTTAPGSELVASQPTYEELPVFAGQLGLQVKWVAPDAAHRHDLAAMRAAITDRTSLVYVCNPNNPTGTAVTRDALAAFVRSVPASTTVVVDEAYIDFLEGGDYGSVAGLVQKVPNLIVLRTFSKIHGLAGLRVGYSMASVELAKRFADLSLVWPNNAGLDAALASYNDAGFLQSTRAAILADRARVHAAIDKLGLPRTEAQGNFVFFDTRVPLQGYRDRMLAQGIKVGRPFAGYPTWSRVSIGRREEIDRFLAALPAALAPAT